ncbi:MAG: nuclear transport factor 2 family protein [Terracidiphilus sp.]
MIYLVTMRFRTSPSRQISKLVFPFAVLLAVLTGVAFAQGTDSNEEQIRAILQKYAISVNNADVALASEIWSHDPDVTFIHPLGTEHGFKQIADDVYIGIMGNMFSKRELVLPDPVIHVYGDASWSEMTWTFHAIKKDGSAVTTEGRETQVYHKENGYWRIVLVHYSGPPSAMPSAQQGR